MLQFMGLLQVVTGNQNPKSLLTIQNMDLINSEYLAATWLPRCSVVKNPPANAGDARDTGSIPGVGKSPGGGQGNHSSIPALRIPRAEEPGRLQSMGSQRVGHNY